MDMRCGDKIVGAVGIVPVADGKTVGEGTWDSVCVEIADGVAGLHPRMENEITIRRWMHRKDLMH
jgi:hypothetical protein